MTSHDVVNRVRKITGERRVGHGGTLDPLAEGVLIVGIGREATKILGTFQRGQDKVYRAVVRLGAVSETDDAEGPVTVKTGIAPPSVSQIREALRRFEGVMEQVPPRYSAVKVKGQPAYRRMRRGESVSLPPRQIRIDRIDFLSYEWPDVVIRIHSASGAYIRSLARDLGVVLGTGGYLARLVRERVGLYTIEDAASLSYIESQQWLRRRP